MSKDINLHPDYPELLKSIKEDVRSTQIRAAILVNSELLKLYWRIGERIAQKQETEGWGTKVIDRLCKDLQMEFPGVEGFSRTNIFRMRAFYLAYSMVPEVPGLLGELPIFRIPWWHNVVLLEKVKDFKKRLWYANRTLEEGWSSRGLTEAIKSDWHGRHGKAVTNFGSKLPDPHSQLAHDMLKSPYNFDFLELTPDHLERDLELGLLAHVEKFLHELGCGFAFLGRQFPIRVGNGDYYIDLLFYHTKLRCYVVVELKTVEFKPEFAGKLNFYLSAVDDLMKHPDDKPTIGILICRTKDDLVVEYAFRDLNKPMGVAEYETKIVQSLPKNLKGSLPSVEDLEQELKIPEEDQKK
jgi:predicted nuclease of restriction endonuclease-like (RecB) superfamily